MSKFPKFRQFAEEKEKSMIQQPTVDAKADRIAGIPNQDIPNPVKLPVHLKMKEKGSPPLGGLDYQGNLGTNPIKGTKENPLPYKGGEADDREKKGVLVHDEDDVESGFGFQGNKIQTPKNSASLGEKPDMHMIQKVKGHAKMTAEQFIEQTKDMSPAEFINFFVEGSDEPLPTVTDLYGNEFTPDPNQTIQYMASLMVKNPRLISRLIREIKRHEKGMNLLVDENFNHPEFYSAMVGGMIAPEEGRKRCHRLSRAMNDNYMEALDKYMLEQYNEEVQLKHDLAFEDGGPMGGPPENPSGLAPKKPMTGGSFGGGGPTPNTPSAIPPGNGGIGGSPDMPQPGPMMGGATGGGSASPTDPQAGGGVPGQGGIAAGPPPMPPGTASGGPPGLDMGTGGVPGGQQAPPMPKLKGETAHGNMIEEMAGFPHMFNTMADRCINCDKKKL